MAKVISWVIRDQYVYIGKYEGGQAQAPTISDEAKSDEFVKDLSYFWVDSGTKEQYRACYKKMYDTVSGEFTNLNPPGSDGSGADIYWNVLGEKGVMIVSGKDGKDNDDPGAAYYNIHNLNQNIGIGLGGDYTLDVDVTARTEIYIEREGVIKNNMISAIRVSELPSSKYSWTDDGDTVIVNICVANGTSFAESPHNKQYTIVVETQDGFTGKTYFTVTGVKNGAEGAYFNLIITPKIVKKVGDAYSDSLIDVDYTSNEDPDKFAIKYLTDSGYVFLPDEYKHVSPKYQIPVSFIEETFTSKTMTLSLFYDGALIDSDTCSITQDGKDAVERAVVELDNEMDGIALGDDNVLDTDLSVGSGAVLWSGGSEARVTRVRLKGISRTDHVDCSVKDGSSWTTKNFNQSTEIADFTLFSPTNKVEFKINFKNGFIFDNYRETITVELTGSYNGVQISAETNYIVIGVKGGKDGDVFRLQPSVDTVSYDPNVNMYSVPGVTCRAFIGMEEIQDFNTIGSDYKLWGSTNFAYNSYEELVSQGTTLFETNSYTFTNSGITSVTFYLLYKISETSYFMVDRETVPVVVQGLNGSDRVYLEIFDEIDPVSVGEDYILNASVNFETSFGLYSGATTIEMNKVAIDVSDSTLNGKSCKLYLSSSGELKEGTIENQHVEFSNLQYNDGTASFRITFGGEGENGVEFYGDHKKRLTITAYRGNTGYAAIYTIIGIKEGSDGVTYEVKPTVDVAVFDPDEGKYYPASVSCSAYIDTEKIPDHTVDTGSSFYITYTVNQPLVDDNDRANTIDLPDTGINLLQVQPSAAALERIYFYLYYKAGENDWIFLDRESMSIVSNGINGKDGENASDRIYLELDDEITGVAIGDDNKLDSAVTIDIPMALYSGATKLTFMSLDIQADTDPSADFVGCACVISNNGEVVEETEFDEYSNVSYTGELNEVTVSITLASEQPLYFGEGGRRQVTFTATYDNIQYSATYTIIGLKGGKDGVMYRVLPSVNAIEYDPNKAENQKYNPSILTCEAYEGGSKIIFPDSGEQINGNFRLRYTTGLTPGDSINTTLPYDKSGITINDQVSNRVYVYLFIKYGTDSWYMIDRESVPIISDGQNAKDRVYFDLENEVTGVGLGGDDILDNDVPITIPFAMYSGVTPITMEKVTLSADTGFSGYSCTLEYQGGSKQGTFNADGDVEFTSLSVAKATAKFTLRQGLSFGDSTNKTIIITAEHDGEPYTARFTIIGIPSGEDGVVFRLMPDNNAIIFNPNISAYTPNRISCEAYAGTEHLTGAPYEIRYSTGATPVSYNATTALTEDIEPDINDQYIFFYLYMDVNGTKYLLDREGVPIIRDGSDARTHAYLELSEEMTGVGLGKKADGTLDYVLDADVVEEIGLAVYSGLSTLAFNQVIIRYDSTFNKNLSCNLRYNNTDHQATFSNTGITYTVSPTAIDAEAIITIPSGLTFDPAEATKKVLIFNVQTVDGGNYSVRYTIMGVPGGKDGVSFRLVPDANIIVRNPNVNPVSFTPNKLNCVAYNGKDLLPTGSGDSYKITYTKNTLVTNPASTTDLPATGVPIVNTDQTVYFYLLAKDSGGAFSSIIDREGIPVVTNGTNASDRVYLELDEEMTGIALGEGDYTLGTSVPVTIPFALYSGATKLPITGISITADTGFSTFTCVLYDGSSQIASGAFNASGVLSLTFASTSNLLSAVITLKNGLTFDATLRKVLTFRVNYGSVNYNSSYTIVGIQGGQDGTSFRLSPSVNSIHKITGSTVSYDPGTITCGAYSNTLEITAGSLGSQYVIAYAYILVQTPNANLTVLPSTGLTIDSDNRIYFYLLYNTGGTASWSSYIIIDRESVPVLKDGTNGEPGAPGEAGLQGAAIRGPYNWVDVSGTTRNFYNGLSSSTYPDSSKFIDIVIYNNRYYRCKTSYSHTVNHAFESSYWDISDVEYNFVATNLLLATNAKINFLSNNELYLMSGDTITGGAKGGGTSSVIFWAGSGGTQGAIDSAPFRVYGDGSLNATKGTFGCLTIGDTYGKSGLYGGLERNDGNFKDVYNMDMSPEFIRFSGTYSSSTFNEVEEVAICPNRNGDTLGELYNACINIFRSINPYDYPSTHPGYPANYPANYTAIDTNESIRAGGMEKYPMRLIRSAVTSNYEIGKYIASTFELELSFVTSDSTNTGSTVYFTKDGPDSTWRFMKMNTGIKYTSYPYVFVINNVDSSMIPYGSKISDYEGYWAFTTQNTSTARNRTWTNILGPNAAKRDGVIYIGV